MPDFGEATFDLPLRLAKITADLPKKPLVGFSAFRAGLHDGEHLRRFIGPLDGGPDPVCGRAARLRWLPEYLWITFNDSRNAVDEIG